MTATFNFVYKRAYQLSSEWNTIVDEAYSGREQRRNLWTSSRKSWQLDFEKTPENTSAILSFFDARKGKYEAFNWTWEFDNQTYLVRFDTDKLDMDVYDGFSEFSLKLVQVNA